MSDTRIRAGRISDAADLLLMIEELAEFENEKGQVDPGGHALHAPFAASWRMAQKLPAP